MTADIIDTTYTESAPERKSVHSTLVRLQSIEELERKAAKAKRRAHWTQEEFDCVTHRVHDLFAVFAQDTQ